MSYDLTLSLLPGTKTGTYLSSVQSAAKKFLTRNHLSLVFAIHRKRAPATKPSGTAQTNIAKHDATVINNLNGKDN